MAVLEELKSKGLDTALTSVIDSYLVSTGDTSSRQELLGTIDEHGLRSNKLMKTVGLLQRNGKLRQGIYKEFVALGTQAESSSAPQQKVESSSDSVQPATGGIQVSEETTPTPSTEAQPATDSNFSSFTDKDEVKIAEKLKKKEELLRKKLFEHEKKIRERTQARMEKRATRTGVKIEEAKEIQDKKAAISAVKAELKTKREQYKVLRDELKALKPVKEKKPKKVKAEAAPAAEG